MPTQVSYSTNPNSYQRLLSAGVSPAQINEAINNGLNPWTLPPEYFGMSSGWSPQSVGPGATPTPTPPGVGVIDFPPASGPGSNPSYGYGDAPIVSIDLGPMSYGWQTPDYGPGSMNAGGSMNFPSGIPDWGLIPSVPQFSPFDPGSMSVGGNMNFSSGLPDWGSLPPSPDYSSVGTDYGPITQNVGGPMDLSGYGGMIGGGWDLYGSPIDYGYLPSSNDYGWTAPDYSPVATASFTPTIQQDFSQTPADVFAGLQDSVPQFSEPTDLPATGDIPTPSGWVDGTPPLVAPPPIPDVPPPDQGPVNQDGTPLPDPFSGNIVGYTPNGEPIFGSTPTGPAPGFTPAGFPVGYTPFAGGGVGPQFSPGLGLQGLANQFGGGVNTVSIAGVPGSFQITPSGQVFSTAVGMFGLGAMDAASAGTPSLGAPLKESNIMAGGADTGWGDLGAISDFLSMKALKYGGNFGDTPVSLGPGKIPTKPWASAGYFNNQSLEFNPAEAAFYGAGFTGSAKSKGGNK